MREVEVKCVAARILSAYNNLLLKGYDHTTGVIPDWLPGEFHEAWADALARGRRPVFGRNHHGFFLRSLGAREAGASADGGAGNGTASGIERPKEAPKARVHPRPFDCFDFTRIPMRDWLYGRHYIRRFVSTTIGPGGSGKSSLQLVEGIAMATGRNLLGEQPMEQLRVWYHNGEDPREELERRVAAICLHYGIDPHELEGRFFLTSGVEMPIKVAGEKGNSEVSLSMTTSAMIIDGIRKNNIDVLILDPLITLHSLAEAENHKMDPVLREFARIASETNCSIELAHHTRKKVSGQEEYTTADARGASAIIDAVRSARTVNSLTQANVGKWGIDELERLSYFRIDKGKANMTRPVPSLYAKFESVQLPNGGYGLPGDDVGVVIRFTPPDMTTPLTLDDIAFLVGATARDDCAADCRSADWFGIVVGQRLGLDPTLPADRAKIELVIEDLRRQRRIMEVRRRGSRSANRRERPFWAPCGQKGDATQRGSGVTV